MLPVFKQRENWKAVYEVVTQEEAAALYGVYPTTIALWINSGFVVARKARRNTLISLSSLIAYRGYPQNELLE